MADSVVIPDHIISRLGETMDTRESPTKGRLLLIGLDAAEWELVTRWAGEGKLPVFRRLMGEGTRAVLSSTAAQLPDTVWASLYTGTNPARFEKFFYIQYDAATLGLRHVPDDAIQATPFWEYLSQAGIHVGVVDVPKYPLSRTLNGFQLTNWGAHATKTARASTPVSLLGEIEQRFGRHPVGDCDAVDDNPRALRKLRQRVLDGVRLRGEVNRWLMRKRSWDVFFTGFSETHCIGHHFWRQIADNRSQTTDHRLGSSGVIEEVYRAIDREIGEMLALVDEDTTCMVFSGHGMGPIYHASWNLPEILDLLGYGRATEQASRSRSRSRSRIRRSYSYSGAERQARVNPWRVLKMVVPGWLQYRIKPMLPKAVHDELLFRWYTGGRKWEGCRAFAIPNNDSVGAIRVSVKGRDRHGLVAPGEEYASVCRDIAAALGELTDPVTGRPVVKRVTLSYDEFRGPFLDQLPDLTVLWDQSFAWNAIHSPRIGTLRLRQQDARSGSHTDHGFVLVTGPGVTAGEELTGCSIYDIAPTILQLAGVRLPAVMDGHALLVRRAAAAA